MICRTTICFTDSEMIEYYKKKRLAEIASLQTQKIHNRLYKKYITGYAKYITLKKHPLWFTLGRMTVMKISKYNSDLQLAY